MAMDCLDFLTGTGMLAQFEKLAGAKPLPRQAASLSDDGSELTLYAYKLRHAGFWDTARRIEKLVDAAVEQALTELCEAILREHDDILREHDGKVRERALPGAMQNSEKEEWHMAMD